MSTRVAMLLAAPFAVLAFGLHLGEALWLEPLSWRLHHFVPGLLTYFGLLAASAAVPIGGYTLLTRSVRRRPRTWHLDVRNRRFTAPASPYSTGPGAVTMGWVCGGIVLTERVPNQEHKRIAELGVATTINIAVAATLMIMVMLFLLLTVVVNRPLLSLDADGMTLQSLGRQTRLRWAELLPGGPPRPGKPNPTALVLYQRRTAPADGPPQSRPLPARRLHIDTAFLADTIRRYADSPDRRAGIGTVEELTALHGLVVDGEHGEARPGG
jgi:hypothetical protein